MEEEKSNHSAKYVFYSLVVIVVLIIILILFLYLIKSPLIFKSGAEGLPTLTAPTTPAVVTSTISLDNSYVFASPLRAKSGGEKIRITVFILNDKGLGISGKKVVIGSGNVLDITPIQQITDNQGRATFDVSSGSAGVFIIQAAADGTNLIQQTTISFD